MRTRLRGTLVWALGVAVMAAGVVVPATAAGTRRAPQHSDRMAALVRSATRVENPKNLDQLRHWRLRVAQARQRLAVQLASGNGTVIDASPNSSSLIVPERGHDDVASMTWLPDGTAALAVRDGRTGLIRWSTSVPLVTVVTTAHLGPAHKTAVVAVETTFVGTDQVDPTGLEGSGEQVTTVVALDAETGKQIWASQPVSGLYSFSIVGFSEVNAVYFGGIVHDRTGDRIVAAELSDSDDGIIPTTVGQAIVFDGTTGAQSVSGQTLVSNDLFMPTPAGDLNHDGLSDWYDVTDGSTGAIDAESGADGSQLWTHDESAAFQPYAVPMPDLDGDRRPDVVVADQDSEDKTALSGATGSTLWDRQAFDVAALGRLAGGQGVALIGGAPSGITLTAVTGHGDTAWTTSLDYPQVKGEFSAAAVRSGFAGDVDGDGALDFYLSVAYVNGNKTGTYTDVISGRTGKERRGRLVGTAIGGSLDGNGADFLVTGGGTKTWSATAFDGKSRRALWTYTTASSGDYAYGSVTGIGRFGRATHPSVLLTLNDQKGSRLMAVDGSTGRLEWQVVQPSVDVVFAGTGFGGIG